MPRRQQSRGKCAYCDYETTKGAIHRHLAACPKRQAVILEADKRGKAETLYHLRVQSADASEFWLDLEMRGSATLNDLDRYLRAIWLECCGHLSEFSLGGAWSGREVAMKHRAGEVFQVGVELTHIYDFGTSSETSIKVVDQRAGVPTTKHPIALMARNLMPEAACMECGEPAAWLCMECVIEEDEEGWLCDKHVEEHPHDSYGEPLPLVNSPRLGMCGYDGPAEPPY
jgi:hypothetical protein